MVGFLVLSYHIAGNGPCNINKYHNTVTIAYNMLCQKQKALQVACLLPSSHLCMCGQLMDVQHQMRAYQPCAMMASALQMIQGRCGLSKLDNLLNYLPGYPLL